MFKRNFYLYSCLLGIISIGSICNESTFARNHHKKGPPPPVVVKNEHPLSPRQNREDISSFAQNAAKSAKQQPNLQTNNKNDNKPALLLPNHYTGRKKRETNGTQGWVNSSRKKRKYDLGINEPLAHTADPTQNKTRGVFRRAAPIYEPNY